MKKEMTSIDVVVSEEVKTVLSELAAVKEAEGRSSGMRQKVYPSDIVREAIQEYLERRGHSVVVNVNRGGDRRSASTD